MPCGPYDQSSSLIRGNSDQQCPKDWQVLRTDQGVVSDLVFTVADPALLGIPLQDANDTNGTAGDELQICRIVFRNHYDSQIYRTLYVHRETLQTFKVRFLEGDTIAAGIFVADLAIYEITGSSYNYDNVDYANTPDNSIDLSAFRPIWVQRMFMEIAPNNMIQTNQCSPLSIAEVRMGIRDMCPNANFLIDDYEVTDKEIMFAIMRVVDYWNEKPPPVDRFSYQNFPFRYHWLTGVVGILYRQIGRWKLRNWLPYTGGGVQVNDQSIWKNYHELGDGYWKEYTDFVDHKKIQLNIEGGMRMSPGRTTGW